MPDWIRVDASARIKRTADTGDSPATADDLEAVANQLGADAVYGTFGEFPKYYSQDKWEHQAKDLVRARADFSTGVGDVYPITFEFNPSLYDVANGGLQHFLGVLAGDLFFLRIRGLSITEVRVKEVKFPTEISNALKDNYGNQSHSITAIRKSFKLENGQPLIAFSFKPRIGLTQDAIREITLGVLQQGFHIVEFDTRYLDLRDKNLDFLLHLADAAAKVGKNDRITRLSVNLSISAPAALEIYKKFGNVSGEPNVIKVDGGFDGLSTVQSIRRQFQGTTSPIITSYPLLRQQLESKIPPDTFLQALTESGVDILYPGNSPSIGSAARELGASEKGAVSAAANRYLSFVNQGRPMVTLAGGTYAGQLHCLYELVGPDVAYFLGGAVALHTSGPIEGAKLCVQILREARERHRPDVHDVNNISNKLVLKAEEAYGTPAGGDRSTFRYVSPQVFLPTLKVQRW